MSDQNTIRNIMAGLTKPQLRRLEDFHTQVAVELARFYGDRLSPIVAHVLVQESTTCPEVLASVEGISGCIPTTHAEWGVFVQKLVNENEIAQRNLAFSDERKREAMRQEELASLRPDQRVTLARNGELDRYLADRIQERLHQNG
ncbi:hypothetical protein [Shimia aestuarii]|uniref:Uncharacterized protein n=1 Tax=Shimia aestuarii TaxID=254406 RepID=A0A1I4IU57_9RHOB|nr:hypothetical protein [Shimia aestuarii]SFL57513.1 hypothetical protein SAMN04488042_101735 [Shimia aestuarii]